MVQQKRQQIRIYLSGLMAYALGDDRIDAIVPADKTLNPGDHHHQAHPGDAHFPVLVLPLDALDAGTTAPDHVFDAGPVECGLWKIAGNIVDIWLDGKPPVAGLHYTQVETGTTPTEKGKDPADLHWLADIKKACGLQAAFRPECFPPQLSTQVVKTLVRLVEGKAEAYWSSEKVKEHVYEFQTPFKGSNVHIDPYVQALADGIIWTLAFDDAAEIRLTSIDGGALRSIYVPKQVAIREIVEGAISSKPATVDGQSVVELREDSVSHFDSFYDLLRPLPGVAARRIPKRLGDTTKTIRCPGASG
jgi:hypothetical protein